MASLSLLDELEHNHLRALWAVAGQSLPDEPRASEAAFHWSWELLKALADRAANEVSMTDADRRVLILTNPASGRVPVSSGTLIAAIQVLNPGEAAEPHRHSIAAVRIITEYDGGITTVDGNKMPMIAGDLILTPPWSWHGHLNDSDRRAMWIDVLDVPLVANLDGIFFQHPDDQSPKIKDAQWESQASWSSSGIVSEHLGPTSNHLQKLRYSWTDVKAALDSIPPNSDSQRRIRYVNSVDGGAVMPTVDCCAMRLESGRSTSPRRSTASTICFVVEGSGTSCVGDQKISWSKNDVFTVPNWRWTVHAAETDTAYLIQASNSDMLRKLGLLREEQG